MLAGPGVPDVRVAVLPAGDDPLAVARHRDLGDRAVPARGDERLARGRVPAVDRAGDRPDERRPVRQKPQPARLAVDLQPLLAGGGVEQPDVDDPPAAASVLPSGEKASDRTLDSSGNGIFSRSLPVAASINVTAGLLPVAAADGDGCAVGGVGERSDAAVAQRQAVQFFAGVHLPPAGEEPIALLVVEPAGDDLLAVRRQGRREHSAGGRERADDLALRQVDQVQRLAVGRRDYHPPAVRREHEQVDCRIRVRTRVRNLGSLPTGGRVA